MVTVKTILPLVVALNGLAAIKIDLPVGSLRGKINVATPSGKKFASFTSIPYAEAPVGKLRFKDPVEKSKWEDVLDATRAPPKCPQLQRDNPRQMQNPDSQTGEEDCLVLNVYVPLDDNGNFLKDNLPVMLWVHGGAFIVGDGGPDMYSPDYFMSEKDHPVVLVTLNYRLGLLGFLSLGNDIISGNMGLKDQTLAMRWVQHHIRSFGGDPDAVTIFGESAGGISIMAHILSPWSKDLFHRAIVQSGPTADAKVLHFSHPPEHYALQVIEHMEFEEPTEELSGQQMLDLLQKAPLKKLLQQNALFEKFMFMHIPWKPIVDKFAAKPFIPDDPQLLLSEGSFNHVPVIVGGNQDEGTMYMVQFLVNDKLFEEVAQDFDTLGPMLFLGVEEDEVTEQDSATAQIFKNEYLDGLHTNFTKDNWQRISKIFTDVLFLVPIDLQARLLQTQMEAPVYYYRYRHKGGLSLPMLYNSYEKISQHDFGVCHADDLFVMFRQEGLAHKNEIARVHADNLMIKKIIGMWTSFAAKGQPHDDWQPLTSEKHQWAILDTKPLKMSWDEDFGQKVEFVQAMLEVLDGYKGMKFEDHPAVKKMMADKSDFESSIDLGSEDTDNSHDEL